LSQPLQYDYIISGAGCAGLSLAVRMIRSGKFTDKKILLIDHNPKKANDRTWCYWEQGSGFFEPVRHKQWQQLWFHGKNYSKKFNIEPYQYKMIRGIDFYEYCFEEIGKAPNFTVRYDKVDHVFSSDLTTGIIVKEETIHSAYVFNSILFEKPVLTEKEYWLLQHFKGWMIKTDKDSFDPGVATLMDFRIEQLNGTAFCYLLPFSERKALVEYTVFSTALLPEEKYDEGLSHYISELLNISDYNVVDQEFGVIPMTNFKFPQRQNNIINIGTAGGRTKGSSGYTFNFIQKHSAAIVEQMERTGNPFVKKNNPRFDFYDSVLLNILWNNSLPGKDIFTDLFSRNKPQSVLRFLDNESSMGEDLRIISSLPMFPFLKAALWQLI
jgi:lycopene beta-cyclase